MKKREKIAVGLSGGIDSAMSLFLLKKQGYEPVGVSLRFNTQPLQKARRVCLKLNVPFHTVDCRKEFTEKVIGYYKRLLKKGRTPSPCVICNKFVKFANLFSFADKHGIKYVATGHYACIKKSREKYQLLRAKDKSKDQSYFLCLLEQKDLARLVLPLGEYTKNEVYKLAQGAGFDFFDKTEQSQDLCFKIEVGTKKSKIADKDGRVLGEHSGLHFYTVGQRRGINISGGPWWVVGFNRQKNLLIVTNDENDPDLFTKEIILTNFNFISGIPPASPIEVRAKVRFNQKAEKAKLYSLSFPRKRESRFCEGLTYLLDPRFRGDDSECVSKIRLVFKKPQKAVTPGQWAVLYKGEVCLGGGEIE